MDIGVLAGTFDPVHLGHLLIAERTREAAGLDRVIFVPAGTPPHRGRTKAPAADRLAMVKLATAGNPFFSVCDFETGRPAPSYTLETVRFLSAEHGTGARLHLILGADAFRELGTWHRVGELVGETRFIVVNRPGFAPAGRETLPRGTRFRCLDAGAFAISAREIRQRVKEGQSIRYLTPDAVREYISGHRLYL